MPSLATMTKEKGKIIEKVLNKTSIQMLHYTKLKPSKMNFYGQTDIDELADSLALAGRILQPLIVRRVDMGEYEVLAGHRRRNAAIANVERGMKQFEFLPCIVLSNSDLEQMGDVHDENIEAYLRYILITTNSAVRELTEYEKMLQVMQLKEILPKMKADENLKGRALRAEISKETKKSMGAVGTYEAIWNHLSGDWMKLFEQSEIGISVAAGLSSLTKQEQTSLLREKGKMISLKDIDLFKDKKSVSESDTGSVNTKSGGFLPDDKHIDKAIKLVFFDFPETEKIIQKLYDGFEDAHELFCQYLPYKNKCVEISVKNDYQIDMFVSEEKITVPVILFWERFKQVYIHRFLHAEVEKVEKTNKHETEKTHEDVIHPQDTQIQTCKGQLTTKDIDIEPDDVVSDSDTRILVTGPKDKRYEPTDEFADYVCNEICRYSCRLGETELVEKCVDCKIGAYIQELTRR